MTVVVTYRNDVMFYEERVPTRWNHEQHNEISPMEAATIQRWSESKFLDKAQVKRVVLFTRREPDTTEVDTGANLRCRSKCNAHNSLTSAVEGKR